MAQGGQGLALAQPPGRARRRPSSASFILHQSHHRLAPGSASHPLPYTQVVYPRRLPAKSPFLRLLLVERCAARTSGLCRASLSRTRGSSSPACTSSEPRAAGALQGRRGLFVLLSPVLRAGPLPAGLALVSWQQEPCTWGAWGEPGARFLWVLLFPGH